MFKRIILSIALITSYSFAVDVNIQGFINADIGQKVTVPKPANTVKTNELETQTNEDLLKAKQKQKSFIEQARDNAEKFNELTKKLNIPISMNIKPVEKKVGSVSWSLVNDKCEFSPEIKKQMFEDAWLKYIDHIKEQIKKILNKDYWKMVAINKSIQGACNTVAKFICVGAQKWMDYVPKEQFQTEYKDCVNKALEGTIKSDIKTYQGLSCFGAGFFGGTGVTLPVCTGFTPGNPSVYFIPPCPLCGIYIGKTFILPVAYVKTGTKVDTNKIAAGISICYPKIYSEFSSEGITRCSEDYYKKCLRIFNSSLEMRMNFFGLEVKKEQQKCMLNKENNKITFKTLINEYFDINTTAETKTQNGSEQKIKTFIKSAVSTNSNAIYDTRTNIINDTNTLLKEFDKINVSGLSAIQKEILKNQFKISFRNWVNYVFNMQGNLIKISKNQFKNITLITGRWDFRQILGHDKRWWLGTNNWNTPIYTECSEIILEIPEQFDNDKMAEILQENPIIYPKPSNYNGRFSYFLKLDSGLYIPELQVKVHLGMHPEENPYITTYLKLQKELCVKWAQTLKTKLDNEWFKARNLLIMQMQQATEKQREEYKNLFDMQEKEWLTKRKLLQDLINNKVNSDVSNTYQNKSNNITYH